VKPADQQLVIKTKEIHYNDDHSERDVPDPTLSDRTESHPGAHALHADRHSQRRHQQLLVPDDAWEGLGQVKNIAPVACRPSES
jgi:hypothetical protein